MDHYRTIARPVMVMVSIVGIATVVFGMGIVP